MVTKNGCNSFYRNYPQTNMTITPSVIHFSKLSSSQCSEVVNIVDSLLLSTHRLLRNGIRYNITINIPSFIQPISYEVCSIVNYKRFALCTPWTALDPANAYRQSRFAARPSQSGRADNFFLSFSCIQCHIPAQSTFFYAVDSISSANEGTTQETL